jgi:hypothetical protein
MNDTFWDEVAKAWEKPDEIIIPEVRLSSEEEKAELNIYMDEIKLRLNVRDDFGMISSKTLKIPTAKRLTT